MRAGEAKVAFVVLGRFNDFQPGPLSYAMLCGEGASALTRPDGNWIASWQA